MADTDFDVVIVGAGISGINTAYRLQTQVPGKSYTILEARGGLGGTWDLFRYPGVRSDSDMYTFGFPWQPWRERKILADGASILNYMKETAAVHGIDSKIRFRHKLVAADWSSDRQAYTLRVDVDGGTKYFHAKFLVLSTGYYSYEEALPSTIPGIENFKGTIVHPQFWPADLDYAGKKVVVIGSGATAVTLIPSIAEKASHVTMLQRSPGYIMSLPAVDTLGAVVRKFLPERIAYTILRWRFLVLPTLFYTFCRRFPDAARRMMKADTVKQLPKTISHDPHFEPAYNPWEQRMCICPDGDFYRSLNEGTADVVTGHIKTVTETSIVVQNEQNQEVDADVIVTATGLKIQLAGGAKLSVDGEPVNASEKFLWKNVMLQDLPNAVFVIGYANASWTVGADAAAQLFTRLLKHMDKNGMTAAVPRIEDPSILKIVPTLDLSSTYVQKAKDIMPKTAEQAPWRPRSNYFSDMWVAKFGDIATGLQFYRVSTE